MVRAPHFFIVRTRTQGVEIHQEKIVRLGKLFLLAPEHSAEDDKAVTEDEYDKAWAEFKVSNSPYTFS